MSVSTPARRVLVAGMGNVLEGDDGFGVRVAQTLQETRDLPLGTEVVEVGIGGMHLVQELLDGWEALVVVDAVDRGDPPGRVSLLRPEVPAPEELAPDERAGFLADLHYTVPAKALLMAKALGVLPPTVFILGCQPETLELGDRLSDVVERALPEAEDRIRSLCRELVESPPTTPGGGHPANRSQKPEETTP